MPGDGKSEMRQQRLAAKLRENLRRRKKQAEARKTSHDPSPEQVPDKGKDR
jgi:hypothetical protein